MPGISPVQLRDGTSVLLMSAGCVLLLSCVCAYSPHIPAGDVSYQWLWCGWGALVFAACTLLSVLLSTEGVRYFHRSVAWGLILLGGVEAVWGLRQIYGFASSTHSLYAVTGSFYNPGPYSGYLALTFPVCLHQWLRLGAVKQRSLAERAGYYLSGGVLFLLLCVLPAGMSRSAWLAAGCSGMWVCGWHYSWGKRLKQAWKRHRMRVALAGVLCGIVLAVGSVAVYHIKEDSARGRLFLWKISSLAVAQRPLDGYGGGHFAAAYGWAQEAYFAKGAYSVDEERVAGSPEYAFNEYLQIAVECGVPILLFALITVGAYFYCGMLWRRIDICGSLLSLAVFSFSSYPLAYPCFWVTLLLLLVACLSEISRKWILLLGVMAGIGGGWLVRHSAYKSCEEWAQYRALYGVGANDSMRKEYERLYPQLKTRPHFLFEYGRCLHKLGEYDASNRILKKAELRSCDPMILNIIGKNYQKLKKYEKAEEYLLRSTHRLPSRIYPYYLLAKLYAEPGFRQPEKFEEIKRIVLTKKPKVNSTAIREMREELEKLEVTDKDVD